MRIYSHLIKLYFSKKFVNKLCCVYDICIIYHTINHTVKTEIGNSYLEAPQKKGIRSKGINPYFFIAVNMTFKEIKPNRIVHLLIHISHMQEECFNWIHSRCALKAPLGIFRKCESMWEGLRRSMPLNAGSLYNSRYPYLSSMLWDSRKQDPRKE